MTTPTIEWQFEEADPSVGIMTESVYHPCTDEYVEAEQESTLATVTRTYDGGAKRQEVAETIKFTCPTCGATTAFTQHWPIEFFEEPRDEEEGR